MPIAGAGGSSPISTTVMNSTFVLRGAKLAARAGLEEQLPAGRDLDRLAADRRAPSPASVTIVSW